MQTAVILPWLVASLALGTQSGATIGFTNVAVSAGVAKGGNPGAVAWFDMDGDGDQDLFVAAIGKDKLFRNDGAGHFTKVKRSGIDKSSDPSFGVAVADFDGDGRIDIFVANLGAPNKLYRNEGDGHFADVSRSAGVGGGRANSYSAAWADYDLDGRVDLFVANGSQQQAGRNYLYHNEGGGRFREVADDAGVGGKDSSLGCAWGDYDDDGYPDLFVANFGQPDRLYRNKGDGTFVDRAATAGVDDTANGAGASWADFDNDGDLDLYVFNTNAGASSNRLYANEGDGTFVDVTETLGLRESGDGEAVVWADFDNDGWLDLFVVNRSDFSAQRNHMYRNLQGERFVDVTTEAGVSGTGSGQPAAAADYDGDGRLDLFVGNLPSSREELFHNQSVAGNALIVRLRGTVSNRDAIGARVIATTEGNLRMTREITSSSGRSSQNQTAAFFGLGSDTMVRSVEVRWPSGRTTRLDEVQAGVVDVVEASGV